MDSSTNLHHHHHQLVDESCNSSASLPSSCFSVADNDHAWRTPSFFLNNNGNIHASCSDEAASNPLNNPIIQEMGFSWPNNNNNEISLNNNQSTSHHQQLIPENIKDEPSSSTSSDHHHHLEHNNHNNPTNFATFSDMLSSSSTSPNDMLLLKNTLSTSYKNQHMISNTHQSSPLLFQPSMPYQNANMGLSTTFSQIFPSVNISNISNNNNNNSMSSPMSSCSSTIDHHQMANNLQGGFDLFATARLLSGGGETDEFNHSAPSSNLLELFKGGPRFIGDQDLHQSNDLKRCYNIAHNNVSSFSNVNNGGPSESKNYIMEQKSTPQTMATNKKQRFESRASCPPFKVRKEKLGDRIAALQQLVSPFGKTDTASVLMEAIGYIKFLQNQVETLSVPYMKFASGSKSSNSQRVSEEDDEYSENNEEPRIKDGDLKSRGLCLVPISCMSYFNLTNDSIHAGVWPPPNFNPAGGF